MRKEDNGLDFWLWCGAVTLKNSSRSRNISWEKCVYAVTMNPLKQLTIGVGKCCSFEVSVHIIGEKYLKPCRALLILALHCFSAARLVADKVTNLKQNLCTYLELLLIWEPFYIRYHQWTACWLNSIGRDCPFYVQEYLTYHLSIVRLWRSACRLTWRRSVRKLEPCSTALGSTWSVFSYSKWLISFD